MEKSSNSDFYLLEKGVTPLAIVDMSEAPRIKCLKLKENSEYGAWIWVIDEYDVNEFAKMIKRVIPKTIFGNVIIIEHNDINSCTLGFRFSTDAKYAKSKLTKYIGGIPMDEWLNSYRGNY